MLNAAIIGLGRWGKSLVNAVQDKSQHIRFVAGATRTRASAETFCRDKGIRLADSFEDVLEDPQVAAVVLATPNGQHQRQIIAAAQAGKHVFVEKPMTLTRAEADTAVAAVQKAGTQLAVGFPRRFAPSIAEIRARLRDGRLGTLVSMVGHQSSGAGAFYTAENWRVDSVENPAGAMTGVGVHLMDHMIEFGGRVREVLCHVGQRGGQFDDTTTLMLNFENGAAGVITCSVVTAPNFGLTIYGTKGLCEISRQQLQRFRFTPLPDKPPEGPVVAPEPEIIETEGFDMLRAELDAFAVSVGGGAEFPVRLDEVLHGMSVLDALAESAASGRLVQVSD